MTGALPTGDPNRCHDRVHATPARSRRRATTRRRATCPNTITSQFTATPHSSMGRFTFPATTQADFLIKLMASQNGDSATAPGRRQQRDPGLGHQRRLLRRGNNDGQPQLYTVYFDIVFNQPFTASQVITESGQTDPARGVPDLQHHQQPGRPGQGRHLLRERRQRQAELADREPRLELRRGPERRPAGLEQPARPDPGVRRQLRRRRRSSTACSTRTSSSRTSPATSTASSWAPTSRSTRWPRAAAEPVRDVLRLGHLPLAGPAAGDARPERGRRPGRSRRSTTTAEDSILQQWGYLNLNNYVMVGDPAHSIIADYYAFGAQQLRHQRGAGRHAQAGHHGQRRAAGRGARAAVRLPARGRHLRLLQRARPGVDAAGVRHRGLRARPVRHRAGRHLRRGDARAAARTTGRTSSTPTTTCSTRATENGAFVPGITPTTHRRTTSRATPTSTCGTCPTTTPALFSLLGGNAKVGAGAASSSCRKPNGFGMFAQLTNEFGFGEQYALDYAGDPAGTQQAVNNIRNTHVPARPERPAEQRRPGREQLRVRLGDARHVPGELRQRHAGVRQPRLPERDDPPAATARPITINAPGASPTTLLRGVAEAQRRPYTKLSVPFSTLARGATLDWTLGTTPTSWGSAPPDAPPSYGPVFAGDRLGQPVVRWTSSPARSATAKLSVTSVTGSSQAVSWTATASSGVTVSPSSGTLSSAPAARPRVPQGHRAARPTGPTRSRST